MVRRPVSPESISRNALGDSLRGLMGGVLCQMSGARRRLDVAGSEQLTDHGQGRAKRKRTGREGVPEAVHPDVRQLDPGSHGPPGMAEVAAAEAPVPIVARKHPSAVQLPPTAVVLLEALPRRELDSAGAELGIGEMNLAGVEINVHPAQDEYLAVATAGAHQHADRRRSQR
ncbi:MAG: hypothetical protein OXU19_09495 [bacterium]|nr:hypothetical protein [bacterium]